LLLHTPGPAVRLPGMADSPRGRGCPYPQAVKAPTASRRPLGTGAGHPGADRPVIGMGGGARRGGAVVLTVRVSHFTPGTGMSPQRPRGTCTPTARSRGEGDFGRAGVQFGAYTPRGPTQTPLLRAGITPRDHQAVTMGSAEAVDPAVFDMLGQERPGRRGGLVVIVELEAGRRRTPPGPYHRPAAGGEGWRGPLVRGGGFGAATTIDPSGHHGRGSEPHWGASLSTIPGWGWLAPTSIYCRQDLRRGSRRLILMQGSRPWLFCGPQGREGTSLATALRSRGKSSRATPTGGGGVMF